jgi:phage terminase large subunit-like protein
MPRRKKDTPPAENPLLDGLAQGLSMFRGFASDPTEQAKITAAEGSFYEFVKQAWGHIDRSQPYSDNWHIKAICLPFDSKIMTEDGEKAIGEIVENKWCGRVLSYNHSHCRCEWRKIKQWMKSPWKKLVRIVVDGDVLEATDDHPVFVNGKGYVNAADVLAGDKIIRLQKLSEEVPRRDEQLVLESHSPVQAVPQQGQDQKGVFQNVREDIVLRVERCLRKPEAVYNISVEENQNYFASGFLVHNCDHLQAVATGKFFRLLINIPPGYCKSYIGCVYFPAWVWLREPNASFLFVTYSEDFALRDSKRCRDLVKSDWYQERWGMKVRVRSDSDTATKWELMSGGSRHATSTRGGGTGARARYITCDDINKVDDAYSEVEKEKAIQIFGQLIAGRGNDPRLTRIVNIQQRLACNDLTGHLLQRGGYVHFYLPMEYEPDRKCITPIWEDPRTEEGESIWPERYTPEVIASEKLDKGILGAPAQLQQNPQKLKEGAIFPARYQYFSVEKFQDGNTFVLDRERNNRIPFHKCRWFQVVDTALKVESLNDYTACGTFVITPHSDMLIYDMAREKIAVPQQYEWILSKRRKYPEVAFQAIEERGSGIGLIQEGMQRGTPFRKIGGDLYQKDAVTRAAEASTKYACNQVFHYRGKPWTSDLESELCGYLFAPHDDMATTVCYAASLMRKEMILSSGLTVPDEDGPEGIFDMLRRKQADGESAWQERGLYGRVPGGRNRSVMDEPQHARSRTRFLRG